METFFIIWLRKRRRKSCSFSYNRMLITLLDKVFQFCNDPPLVKSLHYEGPYDVPLFSLYFHLIAQTSGNEKKEFLLFLRLFTKQILNSVGHVLVSYLAVHWCAGLNSTTVRLGSSKVHVAQPARPRAWILKDTRSIHGGTCNGKAKAFPPPAAWELQWPAVWHKSQRLS